ncbi:hypothetical protein BDQ17DRAFT_1422279 [Cyathus striatus]|nr:hypothetical protein BDQ17DRAFT_1422279 [Cyathus striatus]
MKATLASVALFAAATAQSLFYIYTPLPDPSVCVPFIITWAGGTLKSLSLPKSLLCTLTHLSSALLLEVRSHDLRDANSGATLEDLGTITDGNNFSWVVNEPVGTSLVLDLRDNTGSVVHSGMFRVASGSNISCIGTSNSSSGSSSIGASTGSTIAGATSRGTVSVTTSTSVSVTSLSPSSSSVTAPITISVSTTGATSSGTTSRTSSSADTAAPSAASSASSISQSSAATKTFTEINAVGLFGVVAVALFA